MVMIRFVDAKELQYFGVLIFAAIFILNLYPMRAASD